MSQYLRVNYEPNQNDEVHFIVNCYNNQYVKLGYNDLETCKSVCAFLYEYDIWQKGPEVKRSRHVRSFKPDPSKYQDISFIMVFYNKGVLAKDINAKREKEAAKAAVDPFDNDSETIVCNVPDDKIKRISDVLPLKQEVNQLPIRSGPSEPPLKSLSNKNILPEEDSDDEIGEMIDEMINDSDSESSELVVSDTESLSSPLPPSPVIPPKKQPATRGRGSRGRGRGAKA